MECPAFVAKGNSFNMTLIARHPNITGVRLNFISDDGKVNIRAMVTHNGKYRIDLKESFIFKSVSDENFNTSVSNHTVILTSKPAIEEFSGMYTLTAHDMYWKIQYVSSCSVTIGEAPKSINLTTVVQTGRRSKPVKCFKSNEIIRIYCSSPVLPHVPDIEIYFNGTHRKDIYNVQPGNTAALVLNAEKNPEDFSQVNVTCVAKNVFGTASTSIKLCVSYIFVVGYRGRNITIHKGAILKCKFKGPPAAMTQWVAPNSTVFNKVKMAKNIIKNKANFTGIILNICETRDGRQRRVFFFTFSRKRDLSELKEKPFGNFKCTWCTLTSIIVIICFCGLTYPIIRCYSFMEMTVLLSIVILSFLTYLLFLFIVLYLDSIKSDLLDVFEIILLVLSLCILFLVHVTYFLIRFIYRNFREIIHVSYHSLRI